MDQLQALPINVVDVAVLLILLISAVLAYARGFVHEVLSVGGWIGAIFATFYAFAHVKPIFREHISVEIAADLAAGVVVFIVTLVFLSLLTRAIAKQVQSSSLNMLDRSLGFLFGLARGAVLVCVAFIGLELLLPEDEHPPIVREARTMALIKPGAELLKSLVPDHISSRAINTGDDGLGVDVKKLMSPEPKQSDAPAPEGYDAGQRKSLERLIDGTGSNQ